MGLRRLVRLVRRAENERDVEAELGLHVDMEVQDLIEHGVAPDEARRRALVAFGGLEQVREEARHVQRSTAVEAWVRDTRHSVRSLLRSGGFSLVVVIVLTIGTGGITAVFSLLNAIVLQPLPFRQSDRLVVVKHAAPGLNVEEAGLSSGLYFHYRDHARSFESIGLYTERVLNLRVPGAGTERVQIALAGVTFFQVLGAKPALGRLFTEEDGEPGFMNTKWTIPVLLSHDFWVSHFGGDPTVIGRILTLSESPRQVVGVLEEGFQFPRAETQIWMLSELRPPPARPDFARRLDYSAVARMRHGVTAAAAEAELVSLLPRMAGVYEDASPARMAEVRLRPIVIPLKSAVIGDVASVIWTLFGAMAFLLLLANANAVGLFLIRADDRRREIALRLALGAQAHHVARLFLTEALVLTIAGAALGLLLARALLSWTMALTVVELPRTAEITLDGLDISFAAAVAVIMALLYCTLSLRRQRQPLTTNLDGGLWTTRSRARRWTREPLIALQVALALTLMAGSGLMLKTYRNLSRTPLGFSPDQVVAMEIGLPGAKASRHAQIYRDLIDRVRRLPGIERVAAASFAPLTGSEHVFPVQASAPAVPFKFFTPGYFETLKSPILEGQSFRDGEQVTTRYPVLVSAALARRLYPTESALGKSVRRLNPDGSPAELFNDVVPPFTIVGVVGDVRETTLRQDPTEIVYVPVIEPHVEQSIVPTTMTLLIRTQIDPSALVAAVRKTTEAVDPSLSVGTVRSMDAIVRTARAREGFVGALLVLAGGVSLFLGVVGIYGSVAHSVRRRTREIGIRITLGARPAEVAWMVVAGSIWAVVAGAALGLVVAFVMARSLNSLLFGVDSSDPIVFLTVTGLLVSAAVAGAFLAAMRAVRVDPVLALRAD